MRNAFEIWINGEKIKTIGMSDGHFSATVSHRGTTDPNNGSEVMEVEAGGIGRELDRSRTYSVKWIDREHLEPGDEVTIRIVSGGKSDQPEKVVPASRSFAEEYERFSELVENLEHNLAVTREMRDHLRQRVEEYNRERGEDDA